LPDGLEGDERRAGGERRTEQLRIGAEVLEAEHDLSRTRLAVFRFLQLLDLDHELAFPRIAERGASASVVFVGETDADAGIALYDDIPERSNGTWC